MYCLLYLSFFKLNLKRIRFQEIMFKISRSYLKKFLALLGVSKMLIIFMYRPSVNLFNVPSLYHILVTTEVFVRPSTQLEDKLFDCMRLWRARWDAIMGQAPSATTRIFFTRLAAVYYLDGTSSST